MGIKHLDIYLIEIIDLSSRHSWLPYIVEFVFVGIYPSNEVVMVGAYTLNVSALELLQKSVHMEYKLKLKLSDTLQLKNVGFDTKT